MRNKRIQKFLVLMTCLAMIFSMVGCGETEPVEETNIVESESAVSVENGDLNVDSSVIAVGETSVTYGEYQAYFFLMKSQYEGVLSDGLWQGVISKDGHSVGQEAIESVVRMIIQIKVIAKAAAANGVSLAADEKEECSHVSESLYKKLGDAGFQENEISQEVLTQILEDNKMAEKMYSVIVGQVDVRISDEDAKAARIQMIRFPFDDENKEEIRTQAKKAYDKLQSFEGNFFRFAKDYMTSDEIESVIGKQDERTSLVTQALSMKEDQISEVIEDHQAFYILYCVQTPNKQLREEYKKMRIEQKQTDAFRKAYAQWAQGYEVKVSKSLLAN